ncbi:protein disconnected isoform X2 [Anopheles gambiae]|uniref:protein disconnected isoform X2 n=1 Tax=Anopheles coluzzii TaxID=1518534 RepID=UPI0020FFC656|nr:protein disconnected isoform X2 [Anopheles coluzzii]XP_061515211.1 protein disconnected isoform X2 [Anopheles gambiae]
MPGLFPSRRIDGHDSGTESDGDLEQEDDLIQEHEMELSLSSRQDTVSPTDTACSSESPAFLGPPSSSSHLLAYDQNSSEEELEVINGGGGSAGCDLVEVGSVSGVPSRLSGLPILSNPHTDEETEEEEEEEEEEEDDVTEGIVDEVEEEEEDYVATPGAAPAGTTAAATISESTAGQCGGPGAMDTSGSIVRGREFMVIGACGADEDDGEAEPLDDFAEELSSLTAIPQTMAAAAATTVVPLAPAPLATKLISSAATAGKRLGSVSSFLEKRKRSLAHNSDDEVRYLLEQQQPPNQQQQQQQPTHHHHHPLAHQYHHTLRHHHHHHHHLQHQQQQEELQPEEAAPLSAPVNFRTSPPLEALKPHRGHILQRSTTPLVLGEGCGAAGVAPTAPSGLRPSSGSSLSSLGGGTTGISGFYGTGSNSSCSGSNTSTTVGSCVGGGGGAGGLRFGLGRRPIGCDSPLTAVCHRNSTNPPPHHGGGTGSLGSGLSTTTTRTSSSSSSGAAASLSSAPASLVRLGAGSSPEPAGGGGGSITTTTPLVTSMDVSRSVSPPAKMFHCAVSPRRRQPRHQQQRLQRPHRPCLDFDKMQQLKARSVTTWRHSNEHSGELSVFCW